MTLHTVLVIFQSSQDLPVSLALFLRVSRMSTVHDGIFLGTTLHIIRMDEINHEEIEFYKLWF